MAQLPAQWLQQVFKLLKPLYFRCVAEDLMAQKRNNQLVGMFAFAPIQLARKNFSFERRKKLFEM